tara:strand:- start:113 stop:562 length:450 start_codon:yes stop_codon:yes gene_type:complete
MSKSRMKGYQIAADLKLVKNTAKELSKGYSSTTVKTVQSGYTDYEKLFHSKKAWYETRGIVALCEGCGEELESIQKDARGVVVCNKCLEYGKRGVAALCCDCNKELSESQIAFERGIITKCASCAPTQDPTALYIAGGVIAVLLLIIII